eukprot:ctg_266.g122
MDLTKITDEEREGLQRVLEHVRQCGAKRVVCQFPDDWLHQAPALVAWLQAGLEEGPGEAVAVYVAADSPFGTHAVDEVAASRVGADLVVHFGGEEAFLLPPQRSAAVFVTREWRVLRAPSGERGLSAALYPLLRRRLAIVRRVRSEARIFGLVAASVGAAGHSEVLEHLKRVLRHVGRHYYVLYVGKMTPTKLANFAEIDAFVVISDAQTAAELDAVQRDYWRPLITPYEMHIALLSADEGELAQRCCDLAQYSFDFREVLRLSLPTESKLEEEVAPLGADALVQMPSTALAQQNTETIAYYAARSLRARHWRGLEMAGERAPVQAALPGRSGRARGYDDEPHR